MYDFVNRIINNETLNSKQKIDRINDYRSQLDYAEKIVLGEYKYCDKCDDYYLKGSFQFVKESEPCRICTYADPINSGGDEYKDGVAEVTYKVCPKGHKAVFDRSEHIK